MLGGMKFSTVVALGGKTATGLVVPEEIVVGLGSGKQPKVRVRIGSHTYRTTIFARGGQFLLALSAENREAAGVAAGDQVEIEIQLDSEPREVAVPADLDRALKADPAVSEFFVGLAYTHRKEWVRWVEDAKKPETRLARIERTVAELREGKRTH
jgi:hypothetical protein